MIQRTVQSEIFLLMHLVRIDSTLNDTMVSLIMHSHYYWYYCNASFIVATIIVMTHD